MSRRVIDTSIGLLTITAGPDGVVGVDFGPIGSVDDPGPSAPADAHVQRAVDELQQYLGGHRAHFTVVLDRRARDGFRGEVLTALEAVPYGETVTYGELAAMAGRPRRRERWGRRWPPTRSPSSCPAIEWCAPVACSGPTAGASTPRPPCWPSRGCASLRDAAARTLSGDVSWAERSPRNRCARRSRSCWRGWVPGSTPGPHRRRGRWGPCRDPESRTRRSGG